MVVCLVVRVRNASSQTFHISPAGDPFYTAKIGGQLIGDEPYEVPPGFDEAAEGLVVPWTTTSRYGLVIGEATSANIIRCVVGPSPGDDGSTDWLRLHEDSWEPFAQDRWLALGPRHLLGTIGGVVELQLTFRDSRSCFNGRISVAALPSEGTGPAMSAALIAECSHFEQEAACAPANTVFLNVFDLIPVASIPNAVLCNTMVKTFGAFHAAVEVYGEEWSFYRQPTPDACGICRSRKPREHPVHVYRQSVNLGTTRLKDWEVFNVIHRDVLPRWPSSRYDLIHCNCIHFCCELLQRLGADPAPAWVRGLHETGAALLRPLSVITDHLTNQLEAMAPHQRPQSLLNEDSGNDPDVSGKSGLARSSDAMTTGAADDSTSLGLAGNIAKLGRRLSWTVPGFAGGEAEPPSANDVADACEDTDAAAHQESSDRGCVGSAPSPQPEAVLTKAAAFSGIPLLTGLFRRADADTSVEPAPTADSPLSAEDGSGVGQADMQKVAEPSKAAVEVCPDRTSESDGLVGFVRSWSLSWPGNLQLSNEDEKGNAVASSARSSESDLSDASDNDDVNEKINDAPAEPSRSSLLSWQWLTGNWTLGASSGTSCSPGLESSEDSSRLSLVGHNDRAVVVEAGTVQPYRPQQKSAEERQRVGEAYFSSDVPRPRFLPAPEMLTPRCGVEHHISVRTESFESLDEEVSRQVSMGESSEHLKSTEQRLTKQA